MKQKQSNHSDDTCQNKNFYYSSEPFGFKLKKYRQIFMENRP